MTTSLAGLDVHKRVLMAVVDGGTEGEPAEATPFENRRFGATTSELLHLRAWLEQHGVQEVVMESTAQYWKPVWLALEGIFDCIWRRPGATGRRAARRRTSKMRNGWCGGIGPAS